MIRIMIVDDQSLFREALRTLLSVVNDIEIVGDAGNGEEALRTAVGTHPDVVLMDLRMPIMDGATATKRLKSVLPDCKVIVLTTFDDDQAIFDGLSAGAIGYLLKDTSSDRLVDAIRSAYQGEFVLQPSITAKVVAGYSKQSKPTAKLEDDLVEPLSAREVEVLRLVEEGFSNKEIAQRLVISEGTVKNHLSNILGKLNVKSRVRAVRKAKDMGLL